MNYQIELLQSYKDDFAKYTGSQTALQRNAFFNGIIGQIGLQFSHKQANEIALNSSGNNRELNEALERFLEARLFYRVLHSGAETIPLGGDTKKQSTEGIRISSAKPFIQELTAKMNRQEKAFQLINLPFYMNNQIERIVHEK